MAHMVSREILLPSIPRRGSKDALCDTLARAETGAAKRPRHEDDAKATDIEKCYQLSRALSVLPQYMMNERKFALCRIMT